MKVYALFFHGSLLGIFKTKKQALKDLKQRSEIVRGNAEVKEVGVR